MGCKVRLIPEFEIIPDSGAIPGRDIPPSVSVQWLTVACNGERGQRKAPVTIQNRLSSNDLNLEAWGVK